MKAKCRVPYFKRLAPKPLGDLRSYLGIELSKELKDKRFRSYQMESSEPFSQRGRARRPDMEQDESFFHS